MVVIDKAAADRVADLIREADIVALTFDTWLGTQVSVYGKQVVCEAAIRVALAAVPCSLRTDGLERFVGERTDRDVERKP